MKKPLKILLAVTAGIFAVSLFGTAAFLTVTKDAVIDEAKLSVCNANLMIYDGAGREIQTVSARSKRANTPMDDIPPLTRQAFLSIEDKQFYTHCGISPKRILAAGLKNLTHGAFIEGASTITQQLIKNTHLSNEKTISRKLKEIRLALALERTHSKDEILELYLNTVYFGHHAFGIAEASRYYFGKTPRQLTVAESALLAGLLQSPNRYSPFKNPEKCEKRRNLVLSEMKKDGAIGEACYQSAIAEPLPTQKHDVEESPYLQAVYAELEALSESEGIRNFEGLKLYTALDPDLQASIKEETDSDKAICVIDNRTHCIKALYTSAGNIKRLPGSLLKPLLVYAPALEEGLISPATPILDEKTKFGDYEPSNYKNQYGGYISAREALATSANIPAVKLLDALTVDKACAYLAKLGLDASQDKSLALALGGMREGFTLSELTDAYTVFPSGGEYAKSMAIQRVESRDGKVLYQAEYRPKRVFSEATASLVNDMLQSAVESGTAKKLKPLAVPVCAKTGTVGTSTGNTDAYTVAYTPQYTVGCWLGNADYTTIDTTGGGEACRLVKDVLERLRPDAHAEFQKSDDVIRCTLDKLAYRNEHKLLLADPNAPAKEKMSELFAKQYAPIAKSTYFSNPTICKPSISYQNGCVTIELRQAEYYSYRVERIAEGINTIIYNEIQSTKIDDKDLLPDTTYQYRVTPHYGGHFGEPILLPSVHTDPVPNSPRVPDPQGGQDTTKPPITEKDWWNL